MEASYSWRHLSGRFYSEDWNSACFRLSMFRSARTLSFIVIVLDKSLFGSHTEKALRLALLFYFALVTLLTLELFC